MIAWVLNALKALVLTVLQAARMVCCCGRGGGKGGGGQRGGEFGHGGQELMQVVVSKNENADSNWDRWDDGPRKPETVADHIALYRQSLQQQREETKQRLNSQRSETEEAEEEAAADLFADMAPEVKAQRKLYVGPRGGPGAGGAAGHAHSGARRKSSVGARLMAKEDTADPIMAMGDELADWETVGESGWGDADDAGVIDALREQRRQNKDKGGAHKSGRHHSTS